VSHRIERLIDETLRIAEVTHRGRKWRPPVLRPQRKKACDLSSAEGSPPHHRKSRHATKEASMKRIWIAQVLSLAVAGSMGCLAEDGADELEGAADEQSPEASAPEGEQSPHEDTLREETFEAEVFRRFGPNVRIVYADDPDIHADDPGIAAGWCGTRHVSISNATTYKGWVDGNGPDEYTAAVGCNNGTTSFGATRWCGDRRESSASCSSGIRTRFFIIEDH
jgi:hypothetical protein